MRSEHLATGNLELFKRAAILEHPPVSTLAFFVQRIATDRPDRMQHGHKQRFVRQLHSSPPLKCAAWPHLPQIALPQDGSHSPVVWLASADQVTRSERTHKS